MQGGIYCPLGDAVSTKEVLSVLPTKPWPKSFPGVVSIFCLGFIGLLRNKRCLSAPLTKISGVQAFRWEMGDLLGNCYYIKGRESRIDS